MRTLHHHNKVVLLRHSDRSDAGYRHYSEGELLCLELILFYKKQGFTFNEIEAVLNHSDFDLVIVPKEHKKQLVLKRRRMAVLLKTIDTTIEYVINNKVNMKPERLFEGLPKEMDTSIRDEAIEKFGEDQINKSEEELLKLDPSNYSKLKKRLEDTTHELFKLKNKDYKSFEVQWLIKQHYETIR